MGYAILLNLLEALLQYLYLGRVHSALGLDHRARDIPRRHFDSNHVQIIRLNGVATDLLVLSGPIDFTLARQHGGRNYYLNVCIPPQTRLYIVQISNKDPNNFLSRSFFPLILPKLKVRFLALGLGRCSVLSTE